MSEAPTRTATLDLDGTRYQLPVVEGTEGELAVDISHLRADSGYITLDDGYGNTGSCESAITFIDGEKGILRYRGIPIEEVAANSSFVETAWLVIFGRLPSPEDRERFRALLSENSSLHVAMRGHFETLAARTHPMATLSAMINAVQAYEPREAMVDDIGVERAAASLISKVRTIAAASHKAAVGEPLVWPRHDLKYVENFLHMMFSLPYKEYVPSREVAKALNLFLILHADHEQNCSTSTVRMVASSKANMHASCSAGVNALWGPLHGGANVAVVEMLQQIRDSEISVQDYVTRVKNRQDGIKLMGFGHRVYRNFDPRSRILKDAADRMLKDMHITDPLLDLAMELESAALEDDFFVERKLYPNVDFYSGVILRAIGIPLNMFTVMFAMGRMPGWIANWKEVHDDPKGRIYRPRQIYVGNPKTSWVPRAERD
ncbi:MAG: citrate synthase [Actinomycetales bacterium]